MLRMVNSRSAPRHPYVNGIYIKVTGRSRATCYCLELGCVNMWHKSKQRSTTYCVGHITLS